MIIELDDNTVISADCILYIRRDGNSLYIGTPLRELLITKHENDIQEFYEQIKEFMGGD